MTVESPKAQAQNVLAKSVCLVLDCGAPGYRRQVRLDDVKMEKNGETFTDDEKEEISATKRLFSDRDLKPVRSAINSVKNRLTAMSVDGGHRMFGPRARLIPLLGVDDAIAVLEDGIALVASKADELALRLPEVLEQRRQKLGANFNAAEYPTADDIRASFKITYKFVSFGAPDQLGDVSQAAYQRAKTQWDENLRESYQDVVLGLRESALVVMRELADRLSPDAEGKPKAIFGTALRDVNDLLERLPILNSIGEDGELAAKLARIGVTVQGLDVETLRKAPSVRELLRETAEKTASELEALVVEGRRAITFGPVSSAA